MNDATRAVLVTGASTGIGRAAALALAAEGVRVFAGVRDDAAAARLLGCPTAGPTRCR